MRVVLDTNVLVSALLWKNSVSNRLLNNLLNEEIYISPQIIEELENVLKRDFNEETTIIQELLRIVIIIKPHTKISVCADPDDDKIIECAIDSNASMIITYDKELLSIKEFHGIKITTPEQFLISIHSRIKDNV